MTRLVFVRRLACGLAVALIISVVEVSAGDPYVFPTPVQRVARCETSLASELFTWFNTPSSCCQCLGYGVGAGYHAKLVYGPACTWHSSQQGLYWLSASPKPCGNYCSFGMPSLPNAAVGYTSIDLPHYVENASPNNNLFGPPTRVEGDSDVARLQQAANMWLSQ